MKLFLAKLILIVAGLGVLTFVVYTFSLHPFAFLAGLGIAAVIIGLYWALEIVVKERVENE